MPKSGCRPSLLLIAAAMLLAVLVQGFFMPHAAALNSTIGR